MLLVKHQPKSLPHGASDNETSHGAEALPRLTAVFGGQPERINPPPPPPQVFRAGPPHNTAPETGGWGGGRGEQKTLWLRLVCQIQGCIVRTGYWTDNTAEQRSLPSGHSRYCSSKRILLPGDCNSTEVRYTVIILAL